MKKTLMVLAACGCLGMLFCGCAGVELVDEQNDTGALVADLDYRDFNYAAETMIDSMFELGALVKPDGGRYVVAVGRIKNDTTQYIDVDQLVKKIRSYLLRSGRAVVSTAVGVDGPEDQLARDMRQLRDDDEFNQATVAQKGTLIAPDLSLSGKILERQIRMSSSKTQIEYYFQLTLTQVSTGLAIWEDEQRIIKRAKY